MSDPCTPISATQPRRGRRSFTDARKQMHKTRWSVTAKGAARRGSHTFGSFTCAGQEGGWTSLLFVRFEYALEQILKHR